MIKIYVTTEGRRANTESKTKVKPCQSHQVKPEVRGLFAVVVVFSALTSIMFRTVALNHFIQNEEYSAFVSPIHYLVLRGKLYHVYMVGCLK